ncbi:hypothetical protein KKE26_05770 [bacterium]|nr:hypothetical protein [bacterium]
MSKTSGTKLILKSCLLCLLFLLSSKPVLAHELNWSVAIMLSGQQTNQNYSVQGMGSYLEGNSHHNNVSATALGQQHTVPIPIANR